MSNAPTRITHEMVERDSATVAAFLNYLFWLDEGVTLRTQQIAQLYHRWVQKGEDPWIVCDELGLPKAPDWSIA